MGARRSGDRFELWLGDHIQLTLQTSAALLQRSDHGLVGGLGGTEAAVKWRFLDEEASGVDLSMFPRLLFNVLHSSIRCGLADDGTRFQIPFQVAKKSGDLVSARSSGRSSALLAEAN